MYDMRSFEKGYRFNQKLSSHLYAQRIHNITYIHINKTLSHVSSIKINRLVRAADNARYKREFTNYNMQISSY